MSGTSVDGIDAAVVRIQGQDEAVSAQLLAFSNTPFEETMRRRIFQAFQPQTATVSLLGRLHMELGELYAQAALNVIRKAGLTPSEIDAVGSHGQTVWHEPNGSPPFTIQLGDGNVIAQRTGIPCVSDFRPADLAAGGQGAPLVPFSEFLLYRSAEESVLLQNIGGIGNLTVLPAGCKTTDVFAFDTGPGNMVIDGLMTRLTNGRCTMDQGGSIAAQGKVCKVLLDELMRHPYFAALPPKSTGREMFGADYVDAIWEKSQKLALTGPDLIATATALTSRSIAQAVREFVPAWVRPSRMILGGGGSYNLTLRSFLQKELSPCKIRIQTQEELGMNSDAKEAVAFALLADCTLRGVPSAMPSVTGAKKAAVLGKISLP